ncbi:DUF445 family protein [Ferviditalea candida]|uniref:DUF445 family protein n=1 Tax=Ferviditalea candida TaxID=3108399 RepID=A0ABU5ZF76_9BACL|nr:DUF445 family protein [Paenibacillaceae bacterium T2]
MDPVFYIAANVAIAALVGGITNHLAIKMLFHPRKPLYLAGLRFPFTPGLIPKRKEEIGRSLGTVVADYLVTSHGLVNLLGKPEFRNQVENKLIGWTEEWTSREDSPESILRQWLGEIQWEEFRSRLAEGVKGAAVTGALWLWREKGISETTVARWIPNWSESFKERTAERSVVWIVEEIKNQLRTQQGDRMLRNLTTHFMENAGGLLGTLAGLFLDEDKLNQKVKVALFDSLDSPALRRGLNRMILNMLDKLETMPLSEIVEKLTDKPADEGFRQLIGENIQWERWIRRITSERLCDLFGAHRDWLLQKVPGATSLLISAAQSNAERIFSAIQLTSLVEEQVRQFPVERLEQIILSVTGKEFRAITWLGALLGGLIGLIQALMLQWYMHAGL